MILQVFQDSVKILDQIACILQQSHLKIHLRQEPRPYLLSKN